MGLTAILAVLIRDKFIPIEAHLEAIAAYTLIAVASCALVFAIVGPHRMLWRYISLPEVLALVATVTIGFLLALFISFVASRLENVGRSVLVIHWLLLLGAMIGTRVLVRLWHERARRERLSPPPASVQHVLVVGVSHLTELFLQSVAEYAAKTIDVVGILSHQHELSGRTLRFQKVLGTPEKLLQVIAKLEVHGVAVDRVVVMKSAEELPQRARDALIAVEKSSGIQVDWLIERLGLGPTPAKVDSAAPALAQATNEPAAKATEGPALGRYGYVKRALDITGAFTLSVLLAPLIVVIAMLVALDVGLPLVFWQKRPGRHGYPFKLYKFCTMRGAHDADGNRIPDTQRSSRIGDLLRRTRLDELPQLYNIMIGEMSFIGPRPLLPVDQPARTTTRLLVRSGLTGLAQVNGGRDISPEHKNALDIWYVRNASFWLDIKILLRTPIVMVRGERVDDAKLCVTRAGVESPTYALKAKSVAGDGQVGIAHPII